MSSSESENEEHHSSDVSDPSYGDEADNIPANQRRSGLPQFQVKQCILHSKCS